MAKTTHRVPENPGVDQEKAAACVINQSNREKEE